MSAVWDDNGHCMDGRHFLGIKRKVCNRIDKYYIFWYIVYFENDRIHTIPNISRPSAFSLNTLWHVGIQRSEKLVVARMYNIGTKNLTMSLIMCKKLKVKLIVARWKIPTRLQFIIPHLTGQLNKQRRPTIPTLPSIPQLRNYQLQESSSSPGLQQSLTSTEKNMRRFSTITKLRKPVKSSIHHDRAKWRISKLHLSVRHTQYARFKFWFGFSYPTYLSLGVSIKHRLIRTIYNLHTHGCDGTYF